MMSENRFTLAALLLLFVPPAIMAAFLATIGPTKLTVILTLIAMVADSCILARIAGPSSNN